MELGHPIASLIPSLDSAALEVLAGVKTGLGTTRIHRLAGRGSRQGIQLVLDRLVEHGLVIAEPSNTGNQYSFNRDHLLAHAVIAATKVRFEFLTKLRDHVRHLDPMPDHASVFGSFARGEGGTSSDIDLFLLMPDDYDGEEDRWEPQLQHLGDLVQRWTGNHLETLVLDQAQFVHAAHKSESVLHSIAAEGITLAGPAVDGLLDLAFADGNDQ